MMSLRPTTKRIFVHAAASCFLAINVAPVSLQAQTTTTPIKHVVVIFQENISFDHYFATYPNAQNSTAGEPVFTAAPGTPSVNGLAGTLLSTNTNSTAPFRLSRAQAVTCDQNHNYLNEQQAVDSGLMDKFPESTGVGSTSSSPCVDAGKSKGLVMGYYDGNTVTGIWNYAQNFAMSDNSYGTNFGPSTVGVINLISGQTHGATVTAGNAGGNVGSGGSVIGDPRPDPSLDDCTLAPPRTYITMSGQNVGNLLNTKGLTWGWFQGGFRPSSTNNGAAVCATTHNNISGASAGTDYIPHHAGFMYYASTSNLHHTPPSSTAAIGTTDGANHNYDLTDFFNALAAGNMPAVSYLKAGAYQDGHPGYSDPLDEQTFLANTINTIMQSPFWPSTAIIIAYDDSDGWYDHQMGPVVSQSATSDDALSGTGACGSASSATYQSRCGYGPRLPLLVISPYSKVNYVDHTVTDQSSILKFIEDNFQLGLIGNGSNDAIAGSLMGMFNFTNPTAKAVYIDPNLGAVLSAPPGGGTTGGGTGGGTAVTAAAAAPKNAVVTQNQVQLSGSGSTSVDGKPLTYAWTVTAGSPSASISGANTATPLVQLSGGLGTYSFTLTVTDDTGKTATDTATIIYQ